MTDLSHVKYPLGYRGLEDVPFVDEVTDEYDYSNYGTISTRVGCYPGTRMSEPTRDRDEKQSSSCFGRAKHSEATSLNPSSDSSYDSIISSSFDSSKSTRSQAPRVYETLHANKLKRDARPLYVDRNGRSFHQRLQDKWELINSWFKSRGRL